MPDSYAVHQDAVLSNFAVSYSQNGIWIADTVLPKKMVAKESDKYFLFYQKDVIQVPTRDQRADGAPSSEISWDVTTGTYQCEAYALKDIVTKRARANADQPLDLDQDTTAILTERLMVGKEYRVAAKIFDTSGFTSYTSALGTADKWDSYTSSDSDPLADVDAAKLSVLKYSQKYANTIIMGVEVFDKVKHHPLVIDRIKYNGGPSVPAVVTEQALAQLFGVDKVLVGRAVYNSATEGQTVTPAYIWGKYVMVAYVDPAPKVKGMTMGFQPTVQDMTVSTWYDDTRKGDLIEVEYIADEIIVNYGAGYLYSTVVA